VPPLPSTQQVPTPVVTPPTTPDRPDVPVLVPPLKGTVTEVTVTSVTGTVTPGPTDTQVTPTVDPKVTPTVTHSVTTTPDVTEVQRTDGGLAHTGAPTGILAGLAAALLAAGAGLAVAGRRRDDEDGPNGT
jgi:hypothetical protein